MKDEGPRIRNQTGGALDAATAAFAGRDNGKWTGENHPVGETPPPLLRKDGSFRNPGRGKEKKAAAKAALFDLNGTPGMIRTCDPLIRSQVLYPAELRVRKSE